MNEKVAEHLGELLVFIKVGILEGAAFVANEAPILIQEIIKFSTIRCGVFVVWGIAVIFISVWVFKKLKKTSNERKWLKNDEPGIMLFLFPIAGFIYGVVLLFLYSVVLLKIIFAPRLFLLEYIQQLIK